MTAGQWVAIEKKGDERAVSSAGRECLTGHPASVFEMFLGPEGADVCSHG
jgi:hypothetical protein